MAILGSMDDKNMERWNLLRRVGRNLPSAQSGDPYTGQISDLYKRAYDQAQKTRISPLQVDDIKRLNEAAYLRDANLYRYDPGSFELQRLDRNIAGQVVAKTPREFRNRQVQLADLLTQRARGEAPSVAQLQLQQGADQNQRALLSALASQRGGAGNVRALARAGTESGMNVNNQAALLRAQEMQSAEQNLAELLQSARAVDTQQALANQDAILNAMRFNQAGRSMLEQQRGQDLMRLQEINPQAGVLPRNRKPGKLSQIARFGQAVAPIGQVAQGVGGAAAGIAALSDKNAKTNIEKDDFSNWLMKVPGYQFDYKNPENGAGRRVGVMAQDIEKTKFGKSLVMQTKEGKALDVNNVLGAILATQADAQRRLAKLGV